MCALIAAAGTPCEFEASANAVSARVKIAPPMDRPVAVHMLLPDLHFYPGSPWRYLQKLDACLPGKYICCKETGGIIHRECIIAGRKESMSLVTMNEHTSIRGILYWQYWM